MSAWTPEIRTAPAPMPPNEELKRAFAEALLRFPDDPHKAAFETTQDTGLALQIANLWLRDPEVIRVQKELLDERGAKAFLANKDQQARDIYRIAQNPQVDEEVRLKAHRLYAEIMGHIEKEKSGLNVINMGVMVVKDNGSNDEWEEKTMQQQRLLTANV